ncbi:hypothetical protein V8C35DRAFT_295244 [Trichoderma chlorosporum]
MFCSLYCPPRAQKTVTLSVAATAHLSISQCFPEDRRRQIPDGNSRVKGAISISSRPPVPQNDCCRHTRKHRRVSSRLH